MSFNTSLALDVALTHTTDEGDEVGLADAFAQVCHYIYDNPDSLTWRSKIDRPSIHTVDGLNQLAIKYFQAYRHSDFPASGFTKPDPIVSLVLIEAFDYQPNEIDYIKRTHQHAMSAENNVGALLERYIDSILRPYRWFWCCGSFVKAVDFICRDQDGQWLALQIKNRDNSENSSSSAIRSGTTIQKWFRSFSRREATNWSNLPPLMQGYELSEEDFQRFVRNYLQRERQKRTNQDF